VGEIAETADMVVLVMNYNRRLLGLLAAQPVDVIEAALSLDAITHRQKGIAGSSIIGKDTTLLVDVEEIAADIFGASPADSRLKTGQSAVKHGENTPVTILLVEDSGFFRSQVGKYLEADGYRVLTVEDWQAGLEMLREHAVEVQLVVTDIEMPVMNSLEMTRLIKADPTLAHLPVIALTTLADEADVAAGKAAGVTAYEVKLDKEKLLNTIRLNLST